MGVSEGKELNVLETLNAGFSALAPAGMTPSGLALSADQTRLYIACSDVNALAVADISETRSRVAGFVPAGAYPTAVRVVTGGTTRGPERPQQQPVGDRCSSGRNAAGVDEPGDGADALSRVVFGFPARAALVDRACDLHPDGRSVSAGPNAAKLAREFVRLENFHPAGDTPAAALNWAVAAIAPDFTERLGSGLRRGTLALQRFRRRRAGQPASRRLPVEQRVVGGLDRAQLWDVRR